MSIRSCASVVSVLANPPQNINLRYSALPLWGAGLSPMCENFLHTSPPLFWSKWWPQNAYFICRWSANSLIPFAFVLILRRRETITRRPSTLDQPSVCRRLSRLCFADYPVSLGKRKQSNFFGIAC